MRLFWVGLFYAAYFAFVGLYSPFLGPYLKSLGHSLNVIALALGMMQAMRIFGPFLWGWIADKSGRQIVWLRLGAFLGLIFSVLALSNSQSAPWLIIFIVFLNLSISGLVPLSDAYALSCCHGHAGLYGKVRLFGSIGFVIAVLGFGLWADGFGFGAYPYWVWVALAFAFLAAVQFSYPSLVQESRESHKQVVSGAGLRLLLGSSELRLFWLASFFMIFAHGVFYAYFSLYLQDYNYTESVIGLLWAIGVVFEIVFFAAQGFLYPKLSHLNWLRLSFLACTVRFGLIALFPEMLWVILIAQCCHCLTFAAHHTATISWLRQKLPASHHVRGQAMYATLAYGLGGSLGTFAGKWAWTVVSPSAAFGLASFSGFLALVVGQMLYQVSQQKHIEFV